MSLVLQNAVRVGKKSSPWSKVTPKVRPTVSSALRTGTPEKADAVSESIDLLSAALEGGDDVGAVGLAGQQQAEQDPGLVRVQVAGRDEAPGKQVLFGAGESVGAGEHRPCAGAGREHDRDPPGRCGEGSHPG